MLFSTFQVLFYLQIVLVMEQVPLNGLILLHSLQAHLPLINADSSWEVVFISVAEASEVA